MSERYAELIAQWRAAAAATRKVQTKVTVAFNRHLDGKGPPPEAETIEHLRRLRDIEHAKLEAAMEYARQAASGPASGLGDL
jgi:hypothetical protein